MIRSIAADFRVEPDDGVNAACQLPMGAAVRSPRADRVSSLIDSLS
jgi:hypothetical protein